MARMAQMYWELTWILKTISGKTVQTMLKFLATWPLKETYGAQDTPRLLSKSEELVQ